MTATFALQLRTTDETLLSGADAAGGGGERITVRVQMAEVWDVVKIDTGSSASVASIKELALKKLYPDFVSSSDFYLKLNGFEVLDESLSVAASGAKSGSTYLLTFRRRRPVR